MVSRFWMFGTSRRVLGTWAVGATFLLLWLAAHVLLWLVALPTVIQPNCTERTKGAAFGRTETTQFGAKFWHVDACTVHDGRVSAYINADSGGDTIRVSGVSSSALAGLTPVADVMQAAGESHAPGWLKGLDAITPWASIPADAYGGDTPPMRRVAATDVSSDGTSATFRVPGLRFDDRTEVMIRWVSPADAKRLLDRS